MHQTGIELRASCPTWTEAAVRLKSSYFGLVVAALRSLKRAPGLFAQLGVPTVICGPGSIHQAHQPDEFIAFDQIAKCEGFFDRLLSQLSFPLPDFHRLEAP